MIAIATGRNSGYAKRNSDNSSGMIVLPNDFRADKTIGSSDFTDSGNDVFSHGLNAFLRNCLHTINDGIDDDDDDDNGCLEQIRNKLPKS
ncbi:hypothetical protein DERF_011570 [Dermatophagoides farinae]|uniref:Uncharacterized protein n=1 Tax=Dermatophagoides farinae TaxID=6954 RepID=A0A922L4X4_DERFA|nr:hypothetical protein DERF_011570 [Dermatophagoides farinae]